jgi:hypothetical protein
MRRMRRRSRRDFLALSGTGLAAAVLAALGHSHGGGASPIVPLPRDWSGGGLTALDPYPFAPASEPRAVTAPPTVPPTATPQPTPTTTPEPTPTEPPHVRSEIHFMEGTRYAARVTIAQSAAAGPVVLVLGGVHGNEPAGWTAAEAMAEWETAAGTLIVAPRVNHLAAASNVRTTDAMGDLNRLYPGNADGPPMARMAGEITELTRESGATYVFDLHESWTFYPTALGQTIAAGGTGAGIPLVVDAVEAANERLSARERFSFHDRRGQTSAWNGNVNSSISLGVFVPECTPVLIETAIEHQALARRTEMQELVVRRALERLGMM